MTDLDPASARHRVASDPAAHVWVSASAGTGKTRSLVARVLRLLLAGALPSQLFAITFTRTAAAEMQRRVFATLAQWTGLEDGALDAALAELGETPSPELRARARALLLEVLDAPRGLEIRTIHAAAQALIAAFPVEAGLPPRADPLDERAAAALRARALDQVLEAAAGPAGAALRADFERIAVEAGEQALGTHLPALLRAAPALAAIGSPEAVEPWLRRFVNLPVGPSPQAILEAAVVPPAFDDAALAAFRDVIAVAGRKDADRARACIDSWPGWSPAARVANLAELLNLVFDSNGNRRGTANIAKRLIGGEVIFDRLFDAVDRVRETCRALAFVDHAGAWLRVGMAVGNRYRDLKRARAAVDFDDMVGLAADLLAADGAANAVAEALDREIRHILVDEAQDTSATQWRLIEALAAEFDTGLGQHGEFPRTRFVVGDFKQAIYSFQGTDPRVFLAVRDRWARATGDAGRPLRDVPLDRNFRSAPRILALVDKVLNDLGPEAIGLPPGTPLVPHEAHRAGLPARVLLLDPHVAASDTADRDEAGESELADPAFATRIATSIAALLDPASPHHVTLIGRDGEARPAAAGDVLILLRSRGDLMAALVRALHAERLPVAGVDRARLAEPLAARDLLSLIRFVLQPADDLALAEVLTSPLGGLDHEAIRRLRQPGQTLWQALAASAEPALAAAQALLRDALARADFAGPHAFLEAVLAAGGRAAMRARLGPEADEGIDSLLAEALAFEAEHAPTLQGFLAHVSSLGDPLSRDPDSSPGMIRIMTVHGAKGLEAPIVVLADALTSREPRIDVVLAEADDLHAPLPLIFGGNDRKPRPVAALAEAAAEASARERNRLLYVAMTRAEQVLLVAGQISAKEAATRAKGEGAGTSWHDRIREAMAAMGATRADVAPFGPHLRLDDGAWPAPAASASSAPRPPLPDWATSAAPAETAARPFSPSAPAADDAPAPPPGPAQRAAALRGTLLHLLFEHLPGLPPAARAAAGRRLLEAGGAADPEPLLADALAILDDPALAPLFGPDALAEAPIAGHVDGVTVAGTVDRLLVTPGRVTVLDFKTGLAVPADPASVHPAHLRQMAAYRAVLAAAFPGQAVEAMLLYTAGPRLHVLPDTLLDAHWPPAKAGAGT